METKGNTPTACPVVVMTVEPGICGFTCTITARQSSHRMATVEISGSQCKQIQKLSDCLKEMSFKELFLPLTRNPVYFASEKAGCHSSCVVPAAILKAMEVVLGMALPKDVCFGFKLETGEKDASRTEEREKATKCCAFQDR